MRKFLNMLEEYIIIVNKENKILFSNNKILELLQYSEEYLHNISLEDILYSHKSNTIELIRIDKELARFKAKVIEDDFENEKCKYYILTFEEYTKRDFKAISDIANDGAEEIILKGEKDELINNMETDIIKDTFFSNMSHEFKTPLNVIIASVQIIDTYIEKEKLEYDDVDKIRKYISSIRKNSHRLLRLVNNIIDLTRIDIEDFELNMSKTNIVSVVEDLVQVSAKYIKEYGCDIEFDTSVEEGFIDADVEMIERVLLNLLSNCLKFTNEDGKINIMTDKDSHYVYIKVKDNGIGIEKENLDRVFNSFTQENKTLVREHEGAGIGLTISRKIVRLHGGDIEAKSEVGKGAEFIIKLPIKLDSVLDKEQNNEIKSWDGIDQVNIEFSDIY